MFKFGLNKSARRKAVNKFLGMDNDLFYKYAPDGSVWGEWGGGWTTPPADTPPADKGGNDEGGKDSGTPENVPYGRFKEVNDKKKALESEVAEYKQKEQERLNAQKKQEEEEAKKKGEYEKLLKEKEDELLNYKSKQEIWEKREKEVQDKNEQRKQKLKETMWDNWGTAESIINKIGDDPFSLSETLDGLEQLYWTKKPSQKGGSNIPDGNGDKGKLAEYKERIIKWERLSPNEQREYLSLIED